MTPSETLLEWRRTNPTAPASWLEVCDRLANGPDMRGAWPVLLAAGAKPLQVFNRVTSCLDAASKDARRLPDREERASVDAVNKAASALLDALSKAQVLDESASLVSNGKAILTIAWTDYRANLLEQDPRFSCVSLPEILRTLQEKCVVILGRPSTNAIRRRIDPATRSFVRRLAAHFKDDFGKEMSEVVSRIACSVLQLEDPITGRDVEKILQDSPFRN